MVLLGGTFFFIKRKPHQAAHDVMHKQWQILIHGVMMISEIMNYKVSKYAYPKKSLPLYTRALSHCALAD